MGKLIEPPFKEIALFDVVVAGEGLMDVMIVDLAVE